MSKILPQNYTPQQLADIAKLRRRFAPRLAALRRQYAPTLKAMAVAREAIGQAEARLARGAKA